MVHEKFEDLGGTPFFTGPWPMKLTLSTAFRRKHHAKT
jgi:hypothetical protein